MKPNILKALLEVQKKVQGAPKDGFNDYHNYNYTTAEEMITICRPILLEEGLVVYRPAWKYIPATEMTPPGIECQMVLAHAASGEVETYTYSFPAIPEKGRPVDKAVAAALTSSMGYWLRDLLLLPRGNELSMDNRDDRDFKPEPTPKKPATPPPVPKRPLPPPPDPADEDIPGLEKVQQKTEAGEDPERKSALMRLETMMEVDGIGADTIQRIAAHNGMCKAGTAYKDLDKRALLGLVNNWSVVKKQAAKFAK